MKYETLRRIKRKVGNPRKVVVVHDELCEAPICFVDGKVCTGKFVLGAPACESVMNGICGDDTIFRCPRLK